MVGFYRNVYRNFLVLMDFLNFCTAFFFVCVCVSIAGGGLRKHVITGHQWVPMCAESGDRETARTWSHPLLHIDRHRHTYLAELRMLFDHDDVVDPGRLWRLPTQQNAKGGSLLALAERLFVVAATSNGDSVCVCSATLWTTRPGECAAIASPRCGLLPAKRSTYEPPFAFCWEAPLGGGVVPWLSSLQTKGSLFLM